LVFGSDNAEYYGFVIFPIGSILTGICLIIAGFIIRKKRKDQKRPLSLPAIMLIIGIISVSFLPAVYISYNIQSSIASNTYAKKHPVSAAFNKGDVKKLKAVLESGADPNEILDDKTILQEALLYNVTHPMDRPELYEKIEMLLEAGYDVDERDDRGETLLMYTSIDARWDFEFYDEFDMPSKLAKLFISHGADVDARDKYFRTALMWACSYRGFYHDYDINDKKSPIIANGFDQIDYYNMAKLTPVVYLGQIQAMVDAGADIHVRDKNGFTALDYFEFAMGLNERHDRSEEKEFYNSDGYLESCTAIKTLLLG
jgi:ankyrin repeat protein